MANKKKKRAPTTLKTLIDADGRLGDFQLKLSEFEDRLSSLNDRDHFQTIELKNEMKWVRAELAKYTAELERAAETRGDAELMFLRKLVMVLMNGKPNTDWFLDRLGDVAHLFRDNVTTLDVMRTDPRKL